MNVLADFKKVKAFVLDVDGVLTDGTVLCLESGEQVRTMHVRDGYALQLAVKKGYEVIIISGAKSEGVVVRLKKLGISEVHMGVNDKLGLLKDRLDDKGIQLADVLIMGDDVPDINMLRVAGLSTCPADAIPQVKEIAKYVSPIAGGKGCVRDVIEKVLTLQNHWYDDELNIASI